MGRSVEKIAVSLPLDLYREVERERKTAGMGRSEYVAHAIRELHRRDRQDRLIEQYVRGYERHPESDDEAVLVQRLGVEALAAEPWET